MDIEQKLYDKFVEVLNHKLDSEECSAQDLNVILNFIKYNGLQASSKHKGLKELVAKTETFLPFPDEDELPLRRIK